MKFRYFPFYSPPKKLKVSRQMSHKEGLRRVEGRGDKVDGTTSGKITWTHSIPKR
jgi:hypothetical protein